MTVMKRPKVANWLDDMEHWIHDESGPVHTARDIAWGLWLSMAIALWNLGQLAPVEWRLCGSAHLFVRI